MSVNGIATPCCVQFQLYLKFLITLSVERILKCAFTARFSFVTYILARSLTVFCCLRPNGVFLVLTFTVVPSTLTSVLGQSGEDAFELLRCQRGADEFGSRNDEFAHDSFGFKWLIIEFISEAFGPRLLLILLGIVLWGGRDCVC